MIPLLQTQGVGHAYGSRSVLDSISLSFHQGELVSLLGPNGCGKTTFLKILLGLLVPRQGTVLFNGQPLTRIAPRQYARHVAYVPQIHRTAFPYAVEDVVAMGRLPHQSLWQRGPHQHREWVDQALARMGIDHLRKRSYTEISGGERQLTLIARALAQGADTIIMDEPATALDYGNQIRLLQQLARLSEQGFTCINSTHTPEHALWVSSRAVLIKDGKVIADGSPSEQVTAENLERLYRVRVSVTQTEAGIPATIPEDLQASFGQRRRSTAR
jgi:iron complex transport system ATP-binding protein